MNPTDTLPSELNLLFQASHTQNNSVREGLLKITNLFETTVQQQQEQITNLQIALKSAEKKNLVLEKALLSEKNKQNKINQENSNRMDAAEQKFKKYAEETDATIDKLNFLLFYHSHCRCGLFEITERGYHKGTSGEGGLGCISEGIHSPAALREQIDNPYETQFLGNLLPREMILDKVADRREASKRFLKTLKSSDLAKNDCKKQAEYWKKHFRHYQGPLNHAKRQMEQDLKERGVPLSDEYNWLFK